MFKVFFEHQNCLIFDIAGREVLRVKMRGKSFSFDPTEEKNVAYYTQANLTELWHKRLGHCHLERMLKIQKNDMFSGVPTLSENLSNCNACQFGKQNSLFPNHLGVFMKFKKMVETQSGYKIQFLRSDNGKEYTSTKFNLFL